MKNLELFKTKKLYEKIVHASEGARYTGHLKNIVVRELCSKEDADISFYQISREGRLKVIHAIAKDESTRTYFPESNVHEYTGRYAYFVTYHLKGQRVMRPYHRYRVNVDEHKLSSSGKEVVIFTSKNLEKFLLEPFNREEKQKIEEQNKNRIKRVKDGLKKRGVSNKVIASWAVNACGTSQQIIDTSILCKKLIKMSKTFARFKKSFNYNFVDFCAWYLNHEAKCALCGKTEVLLQQEYDESKPKDLKSVYYDTRKPKRHITLVLTRKNYHEEYSLDNTMLTCKVCRDGLYGSQNIEDVPPRYLEVVEKIHKKKPFEDSSKNLIEDLENHGITKDHILEWAKRNNANDLHIADGDELYKKIIAMATTFSSTYPSEGDVSSRDRKSILAKKIQKIRSSLAWGFRQEQKCFFCGITEEQLEENFFKKENFNPHKNVKKEISLTITEKERLRNATIDNKIFACAACAKKHKKVLDN